MSKFNHAELIEFQDALSCYDPLVDKPWDFVAASIALAIEEFWEDQDPEKTAFSVEVKVADGQIGDAFKKVYGEGGRPALLALMEKFGWGWDKAGQRFNFRNWPEVHPHSEKFKWSWEFEVELNLMVQENFGQVSGLPTRAFESHPSHLVKHLQTVVNGMLKDLSFNTQVALSVDLVKVGSLDAKASEVWFEGEHVLTTRDHLPPLRGNSGPEHFSSYQFYLAAAGGIVSTPENVEDLSKFVRSVKAGFQHGDEKVLKWAERMSQRTPYNLIDYYYYRSELENHTAFRSVSAGIIKRLQKNLDTASFESDFTPEKLGEILGDDLEMLFRKGWDKLGWSEHYPLQFSPQIRDHFLDAVAKYSHVAPENMPAKDFFSLSGKRRLKAITPPVYKAFCILLWQELRDYSDEDLDQLF